MKQKKKSYTHLYIFKKRRNNIKQTRKAYGSNKNQAFESNTLSGTHTHNTFQ